MAIRLPSSKEIKISRLVGEKFPNITFTSIVSDFYKINSKNFDLSAEVEGATKYRAELLSLQEEEIDELHEPLKKIDEEKRIKKIVEIENELFNKPEMQADHNYWNKADYWTPEEFTSLSFEKNPELINKAYILKHSHTDYSQHSFHVELKFSKEYLKRLELISRSVKQFIESNSEEKIKQIFNKKPVEKTALPPKYYINWAKSKDVNLPMEMSGVVKKDDQSIKIEEKFDHLSKKYNLLLAEANKAIQESKAKEGQINSLEIQLRNKAGEFEKLKNEKALGINEKRSLLKIIYGMAVSGYSWDPESTKSSATKDITTDVNENCGKPITDDTVRKWLKEAKQLVESLESED